MSESFNTSIVCGCVIVRCGRDGGSVPTEALDGAKRLVGDGAVICAELTRIWGAAFVVGQPADLASLRTHPRTAARRVSARELVAG